MLYWASLGGFPHTLGIWEPADDPGPACSWIKLGNTQSQALGPAVLTSALVRLYILYSPGLQVGTGSYATLTVSSSLCITRC